ncbi:MAG: right-handed parallel beta-helix repeat-containing protein [Clostridia bacterium]|nr:right-handed parallel beta-helix repeat-containing protein [Clostridia bacterium]
MRHTLLKLILLLAAMCIVVTAASCADNTPSLVILSGGQTAYTIVRGDTSDPEGAVVLRKIIEEKTGVQMKLTTDFESEKSGIVQQDEEITVGTTNRGESAALTDSLRRDDYVIKVEDKRVHITGGSNEAVMAAVERFAEEFVTAEGISVKENTRIEYTGEYEYNSFDIAGVPLTDYVIVAPPGSQDAQNLAAAIEQVMGRPIEVKGLNYSGEKKAIVYASSGYGNSVKYAEKGGANEYGAAYDDGNIYLYRTGELLTDMGLTDWFLNVLNITPEGMAMLDTNTNSLSESDVNITEAVKFGFEIATDAIMAEIDAKADALKEKILSTESTIKPAEGKNAYYVSAEGSDLADGKTPETAWKTLSKLNNTALKEGDVVYFRRGDTFRGNLNAAKGVTYTAYGTGGKPILCASLFDGAVTGTWEETDVENVYRYSERIEQDVGLLVFNHGESYGIKITAKFVDNKPVIDTPTGVSFTGYQDLPGDLFFYHDMGGAYTETKDTRYGYIYMRSDEGNPAERFDSIEFNRRGNVISIKGDNITIDNLCVKYGGSHGVGAGTVNGLTVQNCEFAWIGGSMQHYTDGSPTRFGNAVEIYGNCKDYTVQNCYIHDVYDAGVTHQRKGTGAKDPFIMEDVLYDSNLFVNCIYSIEYFNDQADNDDNIMRNITMTNNICRNAGGFGWQRPNKVARHIQGGWLNNKREYPAENYVVKDNIFDRSCDVLLSISSTDEKDMPILSGNTYIQNFGGDFGMVGVPYDKYYPYDGSVAKTIREIAGDADARIIMIVDEVKSTCEPDYHVNETVAKIEK